MANSKSATSPSLARHWIIKAEELKWSISHVVLEAKAKAKAKSWHVFGHIVLSHGFVWSGSNACLPTKIKQQNTKSICGENLCSKMFFILFYFYESSIVSSDLTHF